MCDGPAGAWFDMARGYTDADELQEIKTHRSSASVSRKEEEEDDPDRAVAHKDGLLQSARGEDTRRATAAFPRYPVRVC